MNRFNLLPDPRFEALQASLRERITSAADALEPAIFPDVFDATMRTVTRNAFTAAGAHEGSIWLAERSAAPGGEAEALVPVFNTGPHADRFVGSFRQPLGKGIISTVFLYQQPFCENEVHRNQEQDPTLDRMLEVRTASMIAVPLFFAGAVRGVMSCVRLARGTAADPPGFSIEDLGAVQLASEVLTRLLDHWLLAVTVAWRPE